MEIELQERKIYEEEETTGNDLGSALMMIGALLLLFASFILLFVGRDILDGVHFFIFWEVAQVSIAVVCIAVGYTKKYRAHVKDDA